MDGEPRTRATLIGRVCGPSADAAAWEEFVAHYGSRLLAWCRAWRLQEADAQDVTQTVLLKLAEKLRDFEYDPARSFRAWLKTVAHHAWRDFVEQRDRAGRSSSEALARLESPEAGQALADCVEQAYEQELLREAMARVQVRVERRTWDAFRLLALENWTGEVVARHLGMKVATVYVARSKVQRMLRAEVARMAPGDPAGGS